MSVHQLPVITSAKVIFHRAFVCLSVCLSTNNFIDKLLMGSWWDVSSDKESHWNQHLGRIRLGWSPDVWVMAGLMWSAAALQGLPSVWRFQLPVAAFDITRCFVRQATITLTAVMCVCVCVRVSCSSPVSRYLSVCIVWSTRRSVCLALTHRAERCLLTFSRHCSTTGSLISMSVYTALALPAVCLSVCLSVSLSVCYSVTHHSISAQSSVLTSKPL